MYSLVLMALIIFGLFSSLHLIIVAILFRAMSREKFKDTAIYLGMIFVAMHVYAGTYPMFAENLFFRDDAALLYPAGGAGSVFEDFSLITRYFAASASTPFSAIGFLILVLYGRMPKKLRVLEMLIKAAVTAYGIVVIMLFREYSNIGAILS